MKYSLKPLWGFLLPCAFAGIIACANGPSALDTMQKQVVADAQARLAAQKEIYRLCLEVHGVPILGNPAPYARIEDQFVVTRCDR